jgi:hypothetical protein
VIKLKTHSFHNAAVAAGDGKFLDNSSQGYKTLTVAIKGTTTSHTVAFKFMNPCGDMEALKGMKGSDWSTGTTTTGTAESWDFDISNKKRIYMDITAMVLGEGTGLTIIGEAGY